jgi:hypothetical protein
MKKMLMLIAVILSALSDTAAEGVPVNHESTNGILVDASSGPAGAPSSTATPVVASDQVDQGNRKSPGSRTSPVMRISPMAPWKCVSTSSLALFVPME